MASKIGLSYRNVAAQTRLSAALGELAELSGEAAVAPPEGRRDGGLEATLRLEWMAEVVEGMVEVARERAVVLTEREERIRELEAELTRVRGVGEAARTRRAAKRDE
jgi:hypothetical protein